MANQSRPQLQHHVDSKHSKDTFEKCAWRAPGLLA